MAKTRASTYPETRTLQGLMEEYLEMLHEAERAAKKVLALNPQTEKFWNELSGSAHLFTSVGDRSESIWREIDKLIDKLPEEED